MGHRDVACGLAAVFGLLWERREALSTSNGTMIAGEHSHIAEHSRVRCDCPSCVRKRGA